MKIVSSRSSGLEYAVLAFTIKTIPTYPLMTITQLDMETESETSVSVLEAVTSIHAFYRSNRQHPVIEKKNLSDALAFQRDIGLDSKTMEFNIAMLSIGNNEFLSRDQSSQLLAWAYIHQDSHEVKMRQVTIQKVEIPGNANVYRIGHARENHWVFLSEKLAETDPMTYKSDDVSLFELVPVAHFDPESGRNVSMEFGRSRQATIFDFKLIPGTGFLVSGIVYHDNIDEVKDPTSRFVADCCYWRIDVATVLKCTSDKQKANLTAVVTTLSKFLRVFSIMKENTWTFTRPQQEIKQMIPELPATVRSLTQPLPSLLMNPTGALCPKVYKSPLLGSGRRVVIMLRANIEIYYASGLVQTRAYNRAPDHVIRMGFVVDSIVIVTHRWDKRDEVFRGLTANEMRELSSFEHGLFCAPQFANAVPVMVGSQRRFFAPLLEHVDHPALLLEGIGLFCSATRAMALPINVFTVNVKQAQNGQVEVVSRDPTVRQWVMPLRNNNHQLIPLDLHFPVSVVTHRSSIIPPHANIDISRITYVHTAESLLLYMLASDKPKTFVLQQTGVRRRKRKRSVFPEAKGDDDFSDVTTTWADKLGVVLKVSGVNPDWHYAEVQTSIDIGVVFRQTENTDVVDDLRKLAWS